ncbi:hypothetical protein LC087_02620 [Bacillus carboniphilus]|uniref:Uncharacterized protein n=1 Tax=Bacillus carboniphilus TaxID=86663 RepID=A0ABY9JUP9_9BACI|nr:hypothetical protein [Bacillus carboniphilus]WLR43120.1 hypothetical protein LC087_02620 [Bacillus carboniphilus]
MNKIQKKMFMYTMFLEKTNIITENQAKELKKIALRGCSKSPKKMSVE